MLRFSVQRKHSKQVRALARITEGGPNQPWDSEVELPDPGFVHAHPGDLGTVLEKDGDELVILWDRHRTVVTVHKNEVVPPHHAVAG
jgi:hypothetical protein